MADLTDEEIAEMRKVFGAGCDGVTIGQCVNVLHILDEAARRRERDARTLATLQCLEWSEYDGEVSCLVCEGFKPGYTTWSAIAGDGPTPHQGHKPDCGLAKLIAELMLDAAETPKEKAALDALPSDPETVLAKARAKKKNGS